MGRPLFHPDALLSTPGLQRHTGKVVHLHFLCKPRSLTRVRLRTSRQRQEMAELWCTTAINVSQEGRHARWEEKKTKTLAFGNAIRKQNFHKPHYVLALCYPSARSVYKYSTSTYNDCFCLFLFHSTATLHWVTRWSINSFFLFLFFMHQS